MNRILPGRNYGWPIVSHGMDYSGTVSAALTHADMEDPVYTWTPSITVTSAQFYTGDKFPNWRNSLFVTGLQSQQLSRLEIEGNKVRREEVVLRGVGRLRAVVNAPDGYLYLLFNDPDRIARLVPADDSKVP